MRKKIKEYEKSSNARAISSMFLPVKYHKSFTGVKKCVPNSSSLGSLGCVGESPTADGEEKGEALYLSRTDKSGITPVKVRFNFSDFRTDFDLKMMRFSGRAFVYVV